MKVRTVIFTLVGVILSWILYHCTIGSYKMDDFCVDECVERFDAPVNNAMWKGNDPLLGFTRCQCFFDSGASEYIEVRLYKE